MSNISNVKKLLWACLCVIGAACSKTSTTPESNTNPTPPAIPSVNAKLYPVNFSLGNIEVSNERIASKEMSARSYLRYLLYVAYDSAGHLASKVEQDSSYSRNIGVEFGIINDSLPAGNYTIVMIGGMGKPYLGEDYSLFDNLVIRGSSEETYYKKFSISVRDKDTATTNVKLTRITGLLQVELTETLPAEVQFVRLSMDGFPMDYHPSGDSVGNFYPLSLAWRHNREESPLFKNTISAFCYNHAYTVTIEGLTSDYEPICKRVVPNVYLYTNKKTVLRGSINMDFSGDMIVSVDTAYSETIIHDFRKK